MSLRRPLDGVQCSTSNGRELWECSTHDHVLKALAFCEHAGLRCHLICLGPSNNNECAQDVRDGLVNIVVRGPGLPVLTATEACPRRMLQAWTVNDLFSGELPESLGQLQALTNLNLDGCRALVSLPESLGRLQALTSLSLRRCSSLALLPESLGQLHGLTNLDLAWCSSLASLPESLGQLQALTSLDLHECPALASLPESLGQLRALTSLTLHECPALASLPDSLGQLQALTSLNLRVCSTLALLPDSLGQLQALAVLNLAWCSSLASLPESLGQLQALAIFNLERCEALASLPRSLGQLQAIPSLSLEGCSSLALLPESLGQLQSLTSLDLQRCQSLTALPESLGQLQALTRLNLERCKALKALPESLGQLHGLTSLSLEGAQALVSLPECLGQLQALTSVNLQGCQALTSLPESLGQLQALTSLDLGACRPLTALPCLTNPALKTLNLRDCYSLVHPPPSIVSKGLPTIQQFFHDLEAFGALPLVCQRLMVLGDGGSGKTTLVHALHLLDNPDYRDRLRDTITTQLLAWPAEATVKWLVELEQMGYACTAPSCPWCKSARRQTLQPGLLFSDLLAPGAPPPHNPHCCKIVALVQGCIQFLREGETMAAARNNLQALDAAIAISPPELAAALAPQRDEQLAKLTPRRPFDCLRHLPHIPTRGIATPKDGTWHGFRVWDFAGQLEFWPLHQFLLSASNVAYVVAFDLSYSFEVCLERLCHWLSLIRSSTPGLSSTYGNDRRGVRVHLVATHADVVADSEDIPALLARLLDKVRGRFAPKLEIHPHVFQPQYDAKDGGGLSSLAAALEACKGERVSLIEYPKAYHDLYGAAAALVEGRQLPLLHRTKLQRAGREAGLESDEQVEAAIATLTTYGYLKPLRGLPFIAVDPVTWLSELTCRFLDPEEPIAMHPHPGSKGVPVVSASTMLQGLLVDDGQILQLGGGVQPDDTEPHQASEVILALLNEVDVAFPFAPGWRWRASPDTPNVIPGLLRAIDLENDEECELWKHDTWNGYDSSSRLLFGRRYSAKDEGQFLPPTLAVVLQKNLVTITGPEHIFLMRKGLTVLSIFGCLALVRFNKKTLVIPSSRGAFSCSLDIAVTALPKDKDMACHALDRLTLELARVLTAQFESTQLRSTAFTRRFGDDDTWLAVEDDAMVGALAFVRVEQERSAEAQRRAVEVENLHQRRKLWLGTLPELVSESYHVHQWNLERILRHRAVLTDRFWVRERLDVARHYASRFGWDPAAPPPSPASPTGGRDHTLAAAEVTVLRDCKLGGGAFGVVYKAEFKGRYIAAKESFELTVLDQYLGPGARQQCVGAILKELATLAALDHPHILPYIGTVFSADGEPQFICTELMPGGSLEALIEQGELPLPRTTQHSRHILLGLQYLHARRIIHRDIKPANILLDGAGRCVIADLGMSRFQDESRRSLSGVGTSTYVAPEVPSGHYGPSADLWSFGLVVVEMCVGVPQKDRAADAAAAVPAIQRLVSRDNGCLADDPEQRPTATQALENLPHS